MYIYLFLACTLYIAQLFQADLFAGLAQGLHAELHQLFGFILGILHAGHCIQQVLFQAS